MATRYTLRCTECGRHWKQVVPRGCEPSLKCPNLSCGHEQVQRGFDPTGPAPGYIGSNVTRLVDRVAEDVMHDYGMTNLKDNLREGDTMAPPLAPKLQQQADTFFGPKPSGGTADAMRAQVIDGEGNRRQTVFKRKRMQSMMATALAGGYAGQPGAVDPVKPLHDARVGLKANFVAGDGIVGGKG